MPYVHKNWSFGDIITADALNNIETGVSEADSGAAYGAADLAQHELTLEEVLEQIEDTHDDVEALQDNAAAALALIETSQDICCAKAAGTGTGTALSGYSIGYQPYDNLFSAHATNGLTCLRAGTYLLIFDAFMKNTNASLRWSKNGSLIETLAQIYTNKTTAVGFRVMGFGFTTLAAGDVITFDITRSTAINDTCSDLHINLHKLA